MKKKKAMTAQGSPEMEPSWQLTKMALQWLLLVGVFMHLLVIIQRPILDPDFFWHLKTGQLIVTDKALPVTDPFAYQVPTTEAAREKFLLTSYWLSQALLFLVYKVGGYNGITALRIIFISVFAVVLVRLYRLRIDSLIAYILLAASVILVGQVHPADRPVILTFFGATLLVWMMEKIREGERPSLLVLPLMLIWANLHGGFVIGDLFLFIFAIGSLIEYRRDRRKILAIGSWAAGGIAVSFLNPNGIQPFIFAFFSGAGSEETRVFNSEYISTLASFRQSDPFLVLLWLMVVLTPVGMFLARKRYWPDLLLWGFVSLISVAFLRNVGFFALALAPVCGYYLDRGIKSLVPDEKKVLKVTAVAAVVMIVTIGYSTVRLLQSNPHRSVAIQALSSLFPVEAATFLEQSGIKGNMFNHYNFGGYLIWRLHPQYRVFVDGRTMNEPLLRDYQKIFFDDLGPDGEASYKSVFAKYKIDFVINPVRQPDGTVPPLIKRLMKDPEWTPVYLDMLTCVLVRRGPQNEQVIDRFGMAPSVFEENLLKQYDELMTAFPGDLNHGNGKADLANFLARPELLNKAVPTRLPLPISAK